MTQNRTLTVTARTFNLKRSALLRRLLLGECRRILITYHEIALFELRLTARQERKRLS